MSVVALPRHVATPRTQKRSLVLLLLAMVVGIPALAVGFAPPWWQSLAYGQDATADLSEVPATPPVPAGKDLRLWSEGEWIGPFFLPADDPMTIYLYGSILEGAALDFSRALALRPHTDLVYLVSGGGWVEEALPIANQIAEADIATVVPTGASCYSACAYLFFAGSMRNALGIVGVHQITGSDAASVQVTLSAVLDALSNFKVPQPIISAMLRTPPNGMHLLDREELQSIGADPWSPMDGFAGILDDTAEGTRAF